MFYPATGIPPRETSMVLSYDLPEKSKRGGSVAFQLPYDLLTVGETVENTADAIGLEAIRARPDSRASVNNGKERLMAIRAFHYNFHVRRKVSEYKRVGRAGLTRELETYWISCKWSVMLTDMDKVLL